MTRSDDGPTLESRVAFLRQPGSYPEPVYRVESIETHMSWVFLTETHAYKLKKPVRSDVIDFGTIEARRHFCEEEVRLNQRLAAGIYLGTVPLAIDACGHLHLGNPDGSSHTIDWLVKMRRLPAQQMLDYRLKNGSAREEDIRHVAARLAGFHQHCARVAIEADAYRRAFRDDIVKRLDYLLRPAYRLAAGELNRICAALLGFLQDRRVLFDDRVRAGKIIEGHGDLRPEHVCLEPEVIIDCLEFSRELRTIDCADEVGFLALECERLGAAELGALLLQAYQEACGELLPEAALVGFYQAYRAILRASIAIRHLDEEKFRYSPEWRCRARAYLELAALRIPSTR